MKQKSILANGIVVSIIVWELPSPDRERPHGIKYSLHCGTLDGKTLVRYDNERGKSDHRHHGDQEERYTFSTLDNLISDFLTDVEIEVNNAKSNN